MAELVGSGEIASRFMVSPSAVSHWIKRSQPGAKSPLRPRFPEPQHDSKTGKLWAWPEVEKWGRKWQSYHPGALPGLGKVSLADYGRDDDEPQEHNKIRVLPPRRPDGTRVGCTCPKRGVISLTCPIHT